MSVSHNGFTLIEVLVALVIAALLTAILLDAAATAHARTGRATQQARAVFLARSLIAKAEVAPLGTATREGDTNGLYWTVDETIVLSDPRGFYGLAAIRASIMDGQHHLLFAAEARRLKRMPRL